MTRREALNICEKALTKYPGGEAAYFSILNDLDRLGQYEEECEEDDEYEEDEDYGK